MKKLFVGLALFLAPMIALRAVDSAPSRHPDNSALADGPAFVREWTPPVYPADALRSKVGGRVVVRIIVDETGNVTSGRVLSAPDHRLADAALAAVKTWKFSPATENAKPVAICMDAPLIFDPAKGAKSWKEGGSLPGESLPQPVRRTAAAAKNAPPGGYPEALTERRLSGRVAFACVVQPDGRATDLRILGASHADFVLPAFDAIAHWEFTPAMQGDLPTASELRGAVAFDSLASTRAEVLAANAITAPDGSAPQNLPLLESAVDAMWPYALLVEGKGGNASVEFTVQPTGKVTDVKVRDATHPDFGRALAAAIEQWLFSPALSEGRTVPVTLVKKAEFKPVPMELQDASGDPVVRLVRLVRAGPIRGGGLDEKISPVYRVAPGYPAALAAGERPSGNTTIEFVIDRDGRARLPRIVSATHEEFGWAAATAVGQWIFKAPKRAGEPAEAKVQIPFNFVPPPL
ncbi:MAG TPA: TonB family protein [Opitutaceae bacterium]|nr:TonB family protein [Opitutaceae bacterium]